MDKEKKEKVRKKRSPGWTGSSKGSINRGSASNSRGNTGGYDSHNIGGHTVNHGDGTATTTDNRGSIRHYSDGGSRSGSGIHWGGGSGSSSHGRHGGDVITKAGREAIIAKEQRARTALNHASSLAIMGGLFTPAGHLAPMFSVPGVGSLALTDAMGTSLLTELSSAINTLNTVATAVSDIALNALSRGFVLASIFYSSEVGKGSDLVPGRTREQFLSLSVPAKAMGLANREVLQQAAKTSGLMNMPIRGKLAVSVKQVDVKVVRTQKSQSVRVVEAKYDENTGLYSHTITDNKIGEIKIVTTTVKESLIPGQPPLVRPLPTVPIKIHNSGHSSSASKALPMAVSKTTPFHDVIVVYPEAAKMEPVYVMFEPKAQSIAEAGRQHHPEPLTEEIAEFKGLIKIKSRTPSKTGEGMKGRWLSAVDGAIYEWNSEIGKLEVVQQPPNGAEQSLKEAGKHYYPMPSTESLTDYQGLLESMAKTPLADGRGKKFRWMDAKGETLYEWNSLIGKMETYKTGRWETEINRSGESVRVWVVESVIDPTTGLYGITLPDEQGKQGRTVLISPVKAPGADGLGHLLHPEGRQIVILNTGNNAPIKTPVVTVYPNPVQPDIDAQIAVPPLETNYKPLYVMFNNPRHLPGVVTGKGQEVTGNWLSKAGEELGAPIPSQIADKLRGKEFSNFDQFRKFFWLEVSKDIELSNQFSPSNKKRMSQGLAPRARNKDTIGGRRSFELHHNKPIIKGGELYNMDNLQVTTPKKHIDIHRG